MHVIHFQTSQFRIPHSFFATIVASALLPLLYHSPMTPRSPSTMEERTVYLRPPVWLPILVAVIACGAYLVGKTMEVRGYQPLQISVVGNGKVFATPDIATLSFGVQTGRQATAQQAIERLRTDMDAIIAAVKKLGIEEKDIRTESLWMNPAYDWIEGRQISRGFEASQSLQVKVRDLAKIGQVLTDATGAGANQAGGVNFTIDDPDTLASEARDEAISDAQEKAKELARRLGRRLSKLKAYNESFGGVPPMPYYDRSMASEGMGGAAAGMPVPSGEQEVNVSVVLTYEVE